MKTKKSYSAGIGSGIILLHAVIIITALILTGCYTDKKISSTSIDIVVVFNKDIPIAKASSILFEKEYFFYEGSDRSKGKKYFHETGPKYIVKVPNEKIGEFNAEMKTIAQIYEIYPADYSNNKD
jgi:hypothetical protein